MLCLDPNPYSATAARDEVSDCQLREEHDGPHMCLTRLGKVMRWFEVTAGKHRIRVDSLECLPPMTEG